MSQRRDISDRGACGAATAELWDSSSAPGTPFKQAIQSRAPPEPV